VAAAAFSASLLLHDNGIKESKASTENNKSLNCNKNTENDSVSRNNNDLSRGNNNSNNNNGRAVKAKNSRSPACLTINLPMSPVKMSTARINNGLPVTNHHKQSHQHIHHHHHHYHKPLKSQSSPTRSNVHGGKGKGKLAEEEKEVTLTGDGSDANGKKTLKYSTVHFDRESGFFILFPA